MGAMRRTELTAVVSQSSTSQKRMITPGSMFQRSLKHSLSSFRLEDTHHTHQATEPLHGMTLNHRESIPCAPYSSITNTTHELGNGGNWYPHRSMHLNDLNRGEALHTSGRLVFLFASDDDTSQTLHTHYAMVPPPQHK